ncbi:cytochrome P450 [Sinirhodobacter populi]|uniref:Cytochrome P450 n=1 Tax=Paenirhodobacter populi TaxID=2306993 RepID=A0A443KQH0_9RHOB|nr:cytochrome P450 [Sinirhodobacter populi]RWR35167.1 cytochrome P450 [Sinirhodobacter populi]
MTGTIPPKPAARQGRPSLLRLLRMFRADMLSALPARLYHAWMAEFRTPFFRSYLCNDPALVERVLKTCPGDFPKSLRIAEGLRPLLRDSVFVTNGATWEHQRRIIDPAFEGGRLHQSLPAMRAAGANGVLRLRAKSGPEPIEIERETSHIAADVIFRTLFSLPIEDAAATAVFQAFRTHQRAMPIVNPAALLALPRWLPRFHSRATRKSARHIRQLIERLTRERAAAIRAGTAPDDLATKIMTFTDPVTGTGFDAAEMVDQVAIFFLAGHETSASALAWALYLLATHPDWQERVAAEARAVLAGPDPDLSRLSQLTASRAVFRETLRLYPPVPMFVRENRCPVRFRGRDIAPGGQIVLSPWHLHRHDRIWDDPDAFDPARWDSPNGRAAARAAFIPFSAGPRVCPGAGFAMAEGPLLLSMILRDFRLEPAPGRTPVPVAHLTVRARDGIWLRLTPR